MGSAVKTRLDGFRGAFFQALVPRILLAWVFWCMDFLGPGGDPEAYHVLGQYLARTWEDPLHADLQKVLMESGLERLEPMYAMHRDNVDRFSEPESWGQYLNTVMPVVFLHGALYRIWDEALAFPLLNAVVSAGAVGLASVSFEAGVAVRRGLVWNPVSLFFAATHFKESITESLVLAFASALYGRRVLWQALAWCAAVGVFRLSYAAVLGAILVVELFGIGGWRTVWVGCVAVPVMLGLPDLNPAGAEGPDGDMGAGLFGRLAGSEWGRKLALPLLGLLLPLPLQGVLQFGAVGAWGVFTAVYGCAYHWLGWRLLASWRLVQQTKTARRMVNGLLTASLVIGYLFLGGPGVKDRYFAPFVAVLIVAAGIVAPGGRREQRVGETTKNGGTLL